MNCTFIAKGLLFPFMIIAFQIPSPSTSIGCHFSEITEDAFVTGSINFSCLAIA